VGEETVPCSKPHSEEIYVTPTLPEGDFPGQDAIFEQAEELCITEFESFVGLPYEESALDIDISTPSERTWREDDRLVICAIFDPTGDTTGTLADANR
jgi:Septum formation